MPWVPVQRPALTKERGIKEQDDYFEELGLDVSSNLPTNHMIPMKTACRLGLDVNRGNNDLINFGVLQMR